MTLSEVVRDTVSSNLALWYIPLLLGIKVWFELTCTACPELWESLKGLVFSWWPKGFLVVHNIQFIHLITYSFDENLLTFPTHTSCHELC